ncbi:MAG: 23S rRNA (pseudouridine(1915)-N(3))-methyltransferase RlmH [Prevotella sp.]|nr:23S rRNA (pseudouridine(1915)-N(3))-methyltransferase RlmH [Prevotella sp.]
MKTNLIVIGKTSNKHLAELVEDYYGRISHYMPFKITYLQDSRRNKVSREQQKEQEADAILQCIEKNDHVVLLDERGKMMTSTEMASWVDKKKHSGRNLTLVIGGPYGFAQRVYDRADEMISLSKMTFSHDMARLLITEQIYRACTILRGESYHHE